MVIDLMTVIVIMFVHWLADFVMQTRKMAENKSKSNYWLGTHVLTYGLGLFVTWPFLPNVELTFLLLWVLINVVLHFIVDYFSSRLSAKFWEKKEVYLFFVTIGFDQFLHLVCLLTTYVFFFGGLR